MSTISIIGTGSMASALAGPARAGVAHSVKHTNFFLGVNILN
jgi:pyrroline-5-carboxylate reductase